MKRVKYFVFDLDGTLLTSDVELTDNTKNQLIKLQDKGYKIILCSGRDFSTVVPTAKTINLLEYSGYIITNNGGEIYTSLEGRWKKIKDIRFLKEEVENIYNLVYDKVLSFVTFSDNYLSTNNLIDGIKNAKEVKGFKMDNNYIRESHKLLLFDTPKNITLAYPIVKDIIYKNNRDLNVFNSMKNAIEITPKGSTKGNALRVICEMKNLTKEEFICFGDGGNDEPMFEYCNISVAMGNANKTLKNLATYITSTNDEEGVYKFLKKYFDK